MKNMTMIPTANLTEAEWQTLRQSFVKRGMVGGSDAGTLLGLNKYKSAINLYYQAIGVNDLPNKMNEAMLHGKNLETYVANCWRYYDGTEEGLVKNTLEDNKIKNYRKVRSIIINPKYPMLFANIDGRITKHPTHGRKAGVLEVKTISGYSADSYEGGIPPNYLVQIQHYMLVTGWNYGEIVYLKDGREIGCVTFETNAGIQRRILDAANDHYNRVNAARLSLSSASDDNERIQMASQYEPDADNSDAFNQFISEKHKSRQDEVIIQGNQDHYSWAKEYDRLNSEIKSLESDKMLYQNKLKQVMEREGATVMEFYNGKITWRKQFNVKL